ncbi:bifunctional lytic transglycosylase/C40 family peptidase [Listeria booriae]|uniref:bifunctional lytic transglycosylase/C40 family peptidase n=1 Tax=Listeria booriae TaxID=1552123 RepID=UPI0021C8D1A7|nr:bifunctional lytic transglycosylase/C40 family peptidase [Listeria booriae]
MIWKRFLRWGVPLLPFVGMILLCFIIVAVVAGSGDDGEQESTNLDANDSAYSSTGLAPEIERFRPLFEKYAQKYGMTAQLNVIMALSMQESGGRVLDVMQSSESIGLPPNSILDPERSIDVGIQHFKNVFQKAHGDIKLTLQSYNYGGGFIDYVLARGGAYTKELALSFSSYEASKLGWQSYGDPSYVDHVMRYLKATPSSGGVVASGDFKKVMNEALKYQGNPYVWGGANPASGFDCSGLTSWCYRMAGVQLPRTAQEQFNTAKRVSETEARAGDLVFFSGTYAGKLITHVGIYLGGGKMYNSNDSGIEYSSITTGYWKAHFYSYGRVLN